MERYKKSKLEVAKIEQDIKELIKEKCREKNLSVDKLANKLGISRPLMYYHINKGNVRILRQINEILGIETESYADSLQYKKLERVKIRLNKKRKNIELLLMGIKSSIEEVEKKQDAIMKKKQPKLF